MNNCNRICQVFTGAILTFKFYNHIFPKNRKDLLGKITFSYQRTSTINLIGKTEIPLDFMMSVIINLEEI